MLIILTLRVSRLLVFLFFFSSRRRHTRFDCDWSSDVCSSDLVRLRIWRPATRTVTEEGAPQARDLLASRVAHVKAANTSRAGAYYYADARLVQRRSEERRVGKECSEGEEPYRES